jgi:hypothetical protein
MKLLLRTLVFHLFCIFTFFAIYFNLSDHFLREKLDTNVSYVDLLLLSTTIQAGVGIADVYPITFLSKMIMIIQQMIMISTHVITLYLFTL